MAHAKGSFRKLQRESCVPALLLNRHDRWSREAPALETHSLAAEKLAADRLPAFQQASQPGSIFSAVNINANPHITNQSSNTKFKKKEAHQHSAQ